MEKDSINSTTNTIAGSDVPCTAASTPVKQLQIFRRIGFGKKHLFAPPDSHAGEYFVINPIPHKHARNWTPVFYRGDNPKYDDNSRKVARAWRTPTWNAFRIELGDGVHEVLENRRRVRERKWYEFKQKFRKFFRMKATPPKKPLEEVQPVEGFVMVLELRRDGFLKRSLKWKLGDQEFKWTGTRRFLPKWSSRWKAISHDMKLVDANNNVIATLEKDRWASYKRPVKAPGTPNKSKTLLGTLSINTDALVSITLPEISSICTMKENELISNGREKTKREKKRTKNLNLDGQHSGDLLEEAMVFTCWIALESEHRLRYKILDVLQQIGEILGG